MTTSPCDCLNECGDDERVKSGLVNPCIHYLERKENERKVTEQLAKIAALRKIYGAANLYELLDKMQARITAFERLL
jgi:hypothetical protein